MDVGVFIYLIFDFHVGRVFEKYQQQVLGLPISSPPHSGLKHEYRPIARSEAVFSETVGPLISRARSRKAK